MQPSSVKGYTALCVLLAASAAATALNLGPVEGSPWLGRPLDVRISAQFSAQEDPQTSCIAAEVRYGDTLLGADKVITRSVPVAVGDNARHVVRIKTSVAVDEPVVSIHLRVGCQEATTKQYLLLAETPPTMTAKMAAKAPVHELPNRTNTRTRPPLTARLTLAPVDLPQGYAPVLRATEEMRALPTEDAQKRATATAWWKALTASLESQMQEAQRLQHVQEQLTALDIVNTANNQGLQALADRVQQADAQRYANGLVYSLAGMLFVAVLAMVWAWRRLRKVRAASLATHLHSPDRLITSVSPREVPVRQSPTPPAPTPDARLPNPSEQLYAALAGVVKVDVALDQTAPNPPKSQLKPTAPAARSASLNQHTGFSHSGYSVERAIDSEEVVNAREQAAFFVTLGQSNKAIEVLTNRIAQIGESSPLVGLDLLKIYHAEGRRDDFEFMRGEFMRWFAVRVPTFDMFKNQGQSLESYPPIEQKIVSLWPTPPVLEYIEACIYQHADEGDGVVFDLQAYLDLLLLYGVAKRIVRQAVDEHDAAEASEVLRIPPRAQDTAPRQAPGAVNDAGLTHRAGSHLRGAAPDDTSVDRMRTPQAEPTTATNGDAEKHKGLTDFGFLHLH